MRYTMNSTKTSILSLSGLLTGTLVIHTNKKAIVTNKNYLKKYAK